jgi:hypothetical protein
MLDGSHQALMNTVFIVKGVLHIVVHITRSAIIFSHVKHWDATIRDDLGWIKEIGKVVHLLE